MEIKKIYGCDIYRDGGSYGLMFIGDDGKDYELFLETRAFEENPEKEFKDPVIYFGDCNSGKIFRKLSWQEARVFIEGCDYSEESITNRFAEFKKIIKDEGMHK